MIRGNDDPGADGNLPVRVATERVEDGILEFSPEVVDIDRINTAIHEAVAVTWRNYRIHCNLQYVRMNDLDLRPVVERFSPFPDNGTVCIHEVQ
ncbi:MAG TPA: hypothetical protein VFY29_06590 [Terriglobia bacterium]|nr:hypothetical protein [Terriglobia bacterium]